MNATIALNSHASPLLPTGSYGVSDDARLLRDRLQEAVERLLTNSFGKELHDAFRQLYEVFDECGRSNWDGYGAQSVSIEAYEKAKRFLISLPFGTTVPQISAEPDGDITFEWYQGPSRVFSVSVSPSNELNYAGLFGASRTYGTEVFHDEIPEVILSNIKRVVF